jgi:hypothetical protein
MDELNVIVSDDGEPWRIDNGGALAYRGMSSFYYLYNNSYIAMGEKKQGGEWGEFVSEINTMCDESFNEFTGRVFKGITDQEFVDQVNELVEKASTCVYPHIKNEQDVRILQDRLQYLQQVASHKIGYNGTQQQQYSENSVQELVQMGFDPDMVRQMLAITDGDVQQALNLLLQ